MALATIPDPHAFLAAAVRISEAGDADAAIALYAPDAVFEIVSDGAHQRHVGIRAVAGAQRASMAVFRRRGLRVTKRLTAATEDTIVNEWEGRLGRGHARGSEVWQFDDEGRVVAHRLYAFLNVKPATSVLARLRIALSHPVTALTMMRELRRHSA
jgi:hypothetical protein